MVLTSFGVIPSRGNYPLPGNRLPRGVLVFCFSYFISGYALVFSAILLYKIDERRAFLWKFLRVVLRKDPGFTTGRPTPTKKLQP
jgi:hypothetical protein